MLTVRAATLDDADDIVRINIRGWQKAYAGIVPDDVLDAMEITGRADRYRHRMRQATDAEHFVATENGTTVGYVGFGRYRIGQQEAALHRTIAEVFAIYVQARRFYERAGFTVDGTTAGYPVSRPDGSVVELPEVRYARALP